MSCPLYTTKVLQKVVDVTKKKEKKVEMIPQGKTPMGGDGARPGKNAKGYVEPMGEEKKHLSSKWG